MIEYLIPIGALVALYGDVFAKTKHGFRKTQYPASSSLNPVKVISGRTWTRHNTLAQKLHKCNNTDFYIGNVRFSPRVLEECKPPLFFRRQKENIKIYLTAVWLKQTLLVFGGMGSGKTVFFLNLLEQLENYENALVHDGGKLEMIAKLYNPLRDIIFNPYDHRAMIHDLLSEDTAIQSTFFDILLRSASGGGENNKFFSTGAKDHLSNIGLQINAKGLTDPKERWSFFMGKIDELISKTMRDTQKSEKDVVSTLKQIVQPLQLMNFRIQNDENVHLFTINEFLNKNHAAKLFVSYPPQLKSRMQGMSAAFIALYTAAHLSRPDTSKRHLYMIDELSSYMRNLNDPETLKDQLELLRAKGGAFIGGLQGIDEDKKTMDILDKTVKSKFFFRTDGRATKDFLINNVQKVRFELLKESENHQRKKSFSTDTAEVYTVTEDDFDELGEKHEYIAQIGDYLFRGYTPLPMVEEDAEPRNIPFIEYDKRADFEDWLAERYETMQNQKFSLIESDNVAVAAVKQSQDPFITVMEEPKKLKEENENYKKEKKIDLKEMDFDDPDFGDDEFDEAAHDESDFDAY